MGPNWVAAIPITTIDPPHCATSPVVPAIVGPGPPLDRSGFFEAKSVVLPGRDLETGAIKVLPYQSPAGATNIV
jgi:hypothetical protein